MLFNQEYIANGQATGEVGTLLQEFKFDPGFLRPFIEDSPDPAFDRFRGRPCAILNVGKRWNNQTGKQESKYRQFLIADLQRRGINSPVFNSTSLPKESWIAYDRAAIEAQRYPLTAWADVQGVSTYTLNGIGKMILEHETVSDVGEAMQDMSGINEGRNDAPLIQLEGLPLPVTYAGWQIDWRKLAASRGSGMPLDTKLASDNGRRIGELLEKQTIGVVNGLQYGGNSTQVGGYGRTSQIYGLVNFPTRLTKTNIRNPAAAAWRPDMLVTDFNAALSQLRTRKMYGPFTVYYGTDWDDYFNGDYYTGTTATSAVASSQTLRERLMKIEGITAIKRLDMLFASVPTANRSATDYYGPGGENYNASYPKTLIFVNMTSQTLRGVRGMGMTTVQWESRGGALINFKTMCIEVPQFFADFYGNCGILHANASSSPI